MLQTSGRRVSRLADTISRHKAGEAVGVYSVCSAHPTVVEAAVAQSWYKLVGDTGEIVSIEHYGESADDKTLFREFGFTPEAVVAAAERSLDN